MPRAERAQEFLINPLAVTRDPIRRAMSLAAQAVYDTLWLESWNEKIPGELPANETILARLAQVSDAQWAEVRNEVRTGFEVSAEAWICRAVQRTKSAQDKWRTKWRRQKKRQRLRGADSPPLSATVSSDGSGSGSGTGSGSRTDTEKPKPPTPLVAVAPFVLPEWVPTEPFNGLVEARKKSRNPMTPRAKQLLVAKLDALRGEGHDPGALLDTATERGWRTVFAPTTNGHAKSEDAEWKVTEFSVRCIVCGSRFNSSTKTGVHQCESCRSQA